MNQASGRVRTHVPIDSLARSGYNCDNVEHVFGFGRDLRHSVDFIAATLSSRKMNRL
jgi:hypothetical protein